MSTEVEKQATKKESLFHFLLERGINGIVENKL